jgi:hypothetical protein
MSFGFVLVQHSFNVGFIEFDSVSFRYRGFIGRFFSLVLGVMVFAMG